MQLIVLTKSDCLGCAMLLCLVVCLTMLASFFLPSHLSLKHGYNYKTILVMVHVLCCMHGVGYIRVRVCVYTCVRVCVYTCVRVCVYTCVRVCVYTCVGSMWATMRASSSSHCFNSTAN